MIPKNFVALVDSEDTNFFLNLDQIRAVTFDAGGCDVWFDANHHIRLEGGGAVVLGQLLHDRSASLNSEPIRLSSRLTLGQRS